MADIYEEACGLRDVVLPTKRLSSFKFLGRPKKKKNKKISSQQATIGLRSRTSEANRQVKRPDVKWLAWLGFTSLSFILVAAVVVGVTPRGRRSDDQSLRERG